MKYLILLCMAATIFSCGDDKDSKPNVFEGWMNTTVNGEDWNGDVEMQYIDDDTLMIWGIFDNPEGVINLKVNFQGEGTYALIKSQAGYYATVGRDVRTSQYDLTGRVSGELLITEYDDDNKIVSGSFNVSLDQTYSNPASTIETLNFTNGSFEGKIRP